MSTVLSHKNGVITEERFQKLTQVQWMFHYQEIMKSKKADIDTRDNIIKVILDTIESVGILANPEMALKLIQERDRKKTVADVESGEDEMMKYLKEIDELAPKILNVTYEKSTKDKYFLPKYQKKKKHELGISINRKILEPDIDDGIID